MMLHNNHNSVLNTGSLKYDRTFQMHAAPPRDPGHLQERGQDVQNLQQRRALQVGAVCEPNAYYIFPNYVAKCPYAHTISYPHFWPQPQPKIT